jgi:hypothetical protein
MKLPIGDDYLIESDESQWTVNIRRNRAGKPEWRPVSYHRTFASAIQSLGQRWVRDSEASTLAEALEVVENVTTQLSQAIPSTLRIRVLEEEWFKADSVQEASNDGQI